MDSMPDTRVICFLSDFGLGDDYVGSCKGVIATISPSANVIDLAHDLPGFGLDYGSEVLEHATRYMPADAVYLAVIDPGVGTGRRGLALRTRGGASLVGPDNGLLLPAADALGGVEEAVSLNDSRYHVHPVSSTFHGRDIFAPVAAWLAGGTLVSEVGEGVDPAKLLRLELPEAEPVTPLTPDGVQTRILAVDRYGNVRLSANQDTPGFEFGCLLKVDTPEGTVKCRYAETFGDSAVGDLLVVPDSHRRLSLSINQGNAAKALGLKVGHRVSITLLEARDPGTDDPG
jgi:S-adenosylmethionine hydrolase